MSRLILIADRYSLANIARLKSWVQTDIGNRGAVDFGTDKPTLTVEQSAGGVVKIVEVATRETHSGKLFKYNGEEEPW